MSMWEFCGTCHAYDNRTTHRCPPAWHIWRPEEGDTEDDARLVYGHSPAEAVETWAARADSDSADYAIVGGADATFHVRRVEGDGRRELVFVVSGESVPQYTARQKR